MDPRRRLTPAACALALLTGLPGCAAIGRILPDDDRAPFAPSSPARLLTAIAPTAESTAEAADPAPTAISPESAPIAEAATSTLENPEAGPDDPAPFSLSHAPPVEARHADASPTSRPEPEPAPSASGRPAIAEANARARAASRADAFENGVQRFAFEPGRIYEIWTAPLRVTTLSLATGETVVSKAAGDTVRWQIGETTSGSGAAQRTHVLIKPLERRLETNLVLTTSHRVYMLFLRSGADDAFNAAVAWRYAEDAAVPVAPPPPPAVPSEPASLAVDRLDAGYRISPRGRRPRWTPISVVSDGTRTLIAFPRDLEVSEAPVLFVIAADGEAQMVNYRQQGAVFVVDRVFDRAELRLGGRRPQVVRIDRLADRGVAR